ncbi:MAG: FAD-dependent oxidoreductase [Candidatus Zhuqueibacterota bacterium]
MDLKTDVLVAGGGASGVCAAIQAARSGVTVVLMEETPWLGGMLTSAGVSAIDGNHKLPSGLWGEFREALYAHYGGPEALATGWVSHTLFEPHVGRAILEDMARAHPAISLHFGFFPKAILKEDETVRGAIFENQTGDRIIVNATITIDATECGDILALAGCDYDLGRDAQKDTGEPEAPEQADDFIQDLTYVAILKDFGPGADLTLPRPARYDPKHYTGICREASDSQQAGVDCQTMLNYGRLPGDKYMLNWPNSGNDFYLNIIEMSRPERIAELEKAKQFTLGCVYFLQTELGRTRLGLADDEFPTPDRLPLIPYHRESRRVKGIRRLTTRELVAPYQFEAYKTGIAVGDYPLDHHHKKAPRRVTENFPDIPAFNVPFGCLIPASVDGLVIAEKSISVTHLVNGCTRLQPVVMQIGQAAGACAALCIRERVQPRALNVRQLQQTLLDAGCWLMPFCDVPPDAPEFQSVQRIGLCGILQGQLISKDWANEMRFHPETPMTGQEVWSALNLASQQNLPFPHEFPSLPAELTFDGAFALIFLHLHPEKLSDSEDSARWQTCFEGLSWFREYRHRRAFRPEDSIRRKDVALLIDWIFDPFHRLPVGL